MTWQEVRIRYPQQWVIVEAHQIRRESGKRIVEAMEVVETCQDGSEARRHCEGLRREKGSEDIYYFHTDRESLEILEGIRLGVQPKRHVTTNS